MFQIYLKYLYKEGNAVGKAVPLRKLCFCDVNVSFFQLFR